MYPFAPNRLVVRVTLGDDHMRRQYGYLISVEDIEPTPVFVSPCSNGHFYMIRELGYDRTHVPMYVH